MRDILVETFDENDVDEVSYKHWISQLRTTLESTTKSSSKFIDELCAVLKILLPHSFIAKEQSALLNALKESLGENEFIIVCDFAENYAFVIQYAAPGFHWNNNQATVYPVIIYFKKNNVLCHLGHHIRLSHPRCYCCSCSLKNNNRLYNNSF